MKIRLHAGSIFPKGFVAEKTIPDYVTGPPDMVVWGDRTFKRTGSQDPETMNYIYLECFTAVILD